MYLDIWLTVKQWFPHTAGHFGSENVYKKMSFSPEFFEVLVSGMLKIGVLSLCCSYDILTDDIIKPKHVHF